MRAPLHNEGVEILFFSMFNYTYRCMLILRFVLICAYAVCLVDILNSDDLPLLVRLKHVCLTASNKHC